MVVIVVMSPVVFGYTFRKSNSAIVIIVFPPFLNRGQMLKERMLYPNDT